MKKPHGRPTLTSVDELDELGLVQLEDHLRFELDELVATVGGQGALANELGYKDASSVSRILCGLSISLPLEKARKLDTSEFSPTIPGLTFEGLVTAIERVRKVGASTDIFLAAPMSASGDKYEADRGLAMDFMNQLRRHKTSVYYAGEHILDPSDFDAQDLAFHANLAHLRTSRRFVLYLPRALKNSRPSSIWVELGIALGLGIPATLFVPNLKSVPFVVERSVQDARGGRQLVVLQHRSDPAGPVKQLAKNGVAVLYGSTSG